MSVQTLTKKLFETTDGEAISKIVKKLMKSGVGLVSESKMMFWLLSKAMKF